MASSQRLSTALGSITRTTANPYICASCCTRASVPSCASVQPLQQHRHNSDLPLTEKLRRKIWGTDNPPGLKDPYGGPSFLERRAAQRKQAQQPNSQSAAEEHVRESVSQLDLAPQTQYTTQPAGRSPTSDRTQETNRSHLTEKSGSRQSEPYEPAASWAGLEWVGHKGEYQFQEPRKIDDYEPWMKPTANERLTEDEIWDTIHESIFDAVQPKELEYDRELALHVTPEGLVSRTEAGVDSDPDAFKDARLDFKSPAASTFKILKNLQQVIGCRIPDPAINKLAQKPNATFRDVVGAIVEMQMPKPLKTHDMLVANEELFAQPNVKISSRKISPVDKERAIGRWKVIEKELKDRGLPVFGRR